LLSIESTKRQKHVYKVIGADVVDSRKGSLVLDTDAAMLTLVTCYPFYFVGHAPKRYIVRGELVE